METFEPGMCLLMLIDLTQSNDTWMLLSTPDCFCSSVCLFSQMYVSDGHQRVTDLYSLVH